MKYASLTAALIATSLVAGCATFSPPPPRPAYTGTDIVDQIDPASLVGSWKMRVLNPRPDEKLPDQTIQINADGTAVARLTNMPEMEEMGLEFESSSNWEVSGDIITTSNVSVKEVSGNSLGSLMTSIANTQSRKMSGSANVMEASSDRMVWAWSEDGTVVEYVRVK